MQLNLHHTLTYTTKGQVPVHIVAKSLLANERLIHEALHLLESLDKDITVQAIQVSVRQLSNQSPLKEGFAIALFVAYQDRLEAEVSDILKALTGSEMNSTLITVLVIYLAICIIDAAVERMYPGKSVKNIKDEYEEKKLIVARMLNTTPQAIEDQVSLRYAQGRGKSLFTKAFDFFQPAKIEQGVEITTGIANISSEAISEIPTALDFTTLEQTHSYPVDGALIEIHRADIDENKHGWRAIIRDVSDRKIRMELDPEIKPSDIYGKTAIRGDVAVVEELGDGGDYNVKTYILKTLISS